MTTGDAEAFHAVVNRIVDGKRRCLNFGAGDFGWVDVQAVGCCCSQA